MLASTFLYGGVVAVVGAIVWFIVAWFRRMALGRVEPRAARGDRRRPWRGAHTHRILSAPAPERRVAQPATRLDAFVPAWQFGEFHELRVNASPARVYAAIDAVRADDIRLFRTLTWIRRLGATGSRGHPRPVAAADSRGRHHDGLPASGRRPAARDPARHRHRGGSPRTRNESRGAPASRDVHASTPRPACASSA